MKRMIYTASIACLAVAMIGRLAFAQGSNAILVVPSKITMLVGETHTFRAVGNDGRMLRNVSWSLSSDHDAKLTVEGEESTIQAEQPSSNIVLTANGGGGSAEARIEIRSGNSLPMGTVKWSVTELPGCKTTKITPAVPSDGGPDVYVQEQCPDGLYVRAITEDGRELWRRNISGSAATAASGRLARGLKEKEETQLAEHINSSARSVCDGISHGMTKDDVSKVAQDRGLRLDEKERKSNSWAFEEQNYHCNIQFGESGTVVKNKKIIITE
jgi:hypothetical protein